MNANTTITAERTDMDKIDEMAKIFNILPDDKRIALYWIAEGMKLAAGLPVETVALGKGV